MMHAGIAKARAVLTAAGATETHAVNRYAHLVGTCRMGRSPNDSVVDQWCRSWDVPNLYICDVACTAPQLIRHPSSQPPENPARRRPRTMQGQPRSNCQMSPER